MSAANYVYHAKVISGLSTIDYLNTLLHEEEVVVELPATVAALPVPATLPLRELTDDELSDKLQATLNANPIWRELIAQKRLSVGIVDLKEADRPTYASVNGRHMMYAASLPKIAVLAAAHDAIERGELEETAEIKHDMRLMIAKSNNAATTRMIDRLSFENIERTMTAPELKLYDPQFGGGLWVGKRYAAGGKRHPDPIKGISHAATTEQICRFFYLLNNDALLSPASCDKMRNYLVDPQLHHKFVNTLDRVAPLAKVYRKSGSWRSFHADVAMVKGPERDYIITALVDDPSGEQICRDLAKALDSLLKA
ncbi:MAG: serine hydrolase [Bacteroidota bacterium]